MREEIRWWLEQSKADLRAAKNSFTSKDFHTSVFSVHQAIEKTLKALYIQQKNSAVMKTHNLIQLGKLLNIPLPLLTFLAKLSPEYALSRYPDASYGVPAERYTEELVKEYLTEGER
jgi:HEPN domain-containing protein